MTDFGAQNGNNYRYTRPTSDFHQILCFQKYNSKLKGNWYDIAPYNITMLQLLHKPEMINFVKEFFNTDVVFSGRPAIHVHDDENNKILEPHQETAQIARDTLVFWSSFKLHKTIAIQFSS